MQTFTEDQLRHLNDSTKNVTRVLFGEIVPKLRPLMDIKNLNAHEENLVLYRSLLDLASTFLASAVHPGEEKKDEAAMLSQRILSRLEVAGATLMKEIGAL